MPTSTRPARTCQLLRMDENSNNLVSEIFHVHAEETIDISLELEFSPDDFREDSVDVSRRLKEALMLCVDWNMPQV